MALDKLVDSTQLDSDLTSVANAIRTKGGTSAQLAFPADFVTAIGAIPTGGGGETVMHQITNIGASGLVSATLPAICFFGELTSLGQYGLRYSTGKKIIVMPKISSLGSQCFPETSDTATLETLDLGTSTPTLGTWMLSGCAKLATIIIRKASVVTLQGTNTLNATPFADNGAATGGVLYVPENLIASYQAASNWSTILGYTKNQIKSIESTHTDPTAPIDLTLYYADGTAIS